MRAVHGADDDAGGAGLDPPGFGQLRIRALEDFDLYFRAVEDSIRALEDSGT